MPLPNPKPRRLHKAAAQLHKAPWHTKGRGLWRRHLFGLSNNLSGWLTSRHVKAARVMAYLT